MILIPWIFKLEKWLNVVGFVKKHLDLALVMRTIWENIITNQKKAMIHMASHITQVRQTI